jgi:hypothetical protein
LQFEAESPNRVKDGCEAKHNGKMVMVRFVGLKNEPQNVMDTVCDSQPIRKMATIVRGGRKTGRTHLTDRFCDSKKNRKCWGIDFAIRGRIAKWRRMHGAVVENNRRIDFAMRKRIANSKKPILRFRTESPHANKCMARLVHGWQIPGGCIFPFKKELQNVMNCFLRFEKESQNCGQGILRFGRESQRAFLLILRFNFESQEQSIRFCDFFLNRKM